MMANPRTQKYGQAGRAKSLFYRVICIICSLLFLCQLSSSQNFRNSYPDSLNKKRLTGFLITGTTAYALTMTGLYQLWYKNYPTSSFHFINDNREWLQMDKMGHTTTSYYLGRLVYNALRWTGVKENKAIWLGGASGLFFVTTIDIFDGFSKEWGASPGDLIANTSGTVLFIAQQLLWHEQRFTLKYSFHQTEFPAYNPEQLGKNFFQQAIKDYNGQTFWLSANIKSFCRKKSSFPAWINVAVGYGATGMTGANSNYEGPDPSIPEFDRVRQFYLAPDIDLTRIPVKSGVLKVIFNTIGFIKFPLPALEYNKQEKFSFHWIYF